MGDFNLTTLLFGIIGGLGLFVWGIRMMGDGLQKIAGQRMREVLAHLTNNRFVGLGLGALITSIIQSSSATSVMVVGFVNAGLITLTQAIPVIFGANIGTTITAQLIAFKLTDYALPILGAGVAMYLFGKKKKTKQIGETILGFGILFLGLNIMSSGVKPLGESAIVKHAFTYLSSNIFLGILAGLIVTSIIQSSSVTVGIVLTLASVGLLDLKGAIPIVLGDNIGTCITAVLASIGANISAKRAAVSHVLFNVIGTVIAVIFFPVYYWVVVNSSSDIMRQIANFHTLFNVVNATLFIGFVALFAKLAKKIIPGREVVIERGPKYLDKNLIATPPLAIEAAKKEIIRTLKFAKEMFENAMNSFYNKDKKEVKKVLAREEMVDELQDSITSYLIKITQRELSEESASMIPSLLHSINDIERVADHAVNIAQLAERRIDLGLVFSETALKEIKALDPIVKDMINDTIGALPNLDKTLAMDIIEKEKRIDNLVLEFRTTHCERLSKGICKHIAGLVFVDLLMNFEKIGDHLTNISQAIQGKMSWRNDSQKFKQ